MNPILIKITIRRFFELLLTSAVISAFITFLHISAVLITNGSLCLGLLTGVSVFIFINVRMLRQCYFELRSNFLYFLINISSYMIFAVVSLAVYYFCSSKCFTWMFAIMKFVRFSFAGVAILSSVLLFHTIGILMIIFAPVGMKWVFMHSDNEDDEKDLSQEECA